MSALRVFVSHTSELANHPADRTFIQAAIDGIRRAGFACVQMGDFSAAAIPAEKLCKVKVEECDVFLAVLGHRYGSLVRGRDDISYTEMEYRVAVETRKPRLIFLLDGPRTGEAIDDKAKKDIDRQEIFRNAVLSDNDQTCKKFKTPHKLELEIFHALNEYRNQSSISYGQNRNGGSAKTRLAAPLKPYLVDRKSQEDLFERSIHSLRTTEVESYPRSIIVIVHGREKQGHRPFIARLKEQVLLRALGLRSDQRAIHEVHFEYPKDSASEADFHRALLFRIASKVARADLKSSQDLLPILSAPPLGPLLMHTHLLTDDLMRMGVSNLQLFLKFWNSLPYREMPFPPVVCLCIKYIERSGFKGWWQRRQNVATRKYLQALNKNEFENIQVLVLPELIDLDQGHVEDWLQEEFEFDQRMELQPMVDSLFKQNRVVAMEDFATYSKQWCHE